MTSPEWPDVSDAEVEAAAREQWRQEHGRISSHDSVRTPESDERESAADGYATWDRGLVSDAVKNGYRRRARAVLTAARSVLPEPDAVAELRACIEFAHEEQRQTVSEGRDQEPMTLFQHWSATAGWLASRIRAYERGGEPNMPDAMVARTAPPTEPAEVERVSSAMRSAILAEGYADPWLTPEVEELRAEVAYLTKSRDSILEVAERDRATARSNLAVLTDACARADRLAAARLADLADRDKTIAGVRAEAQQWRGQWHSSSKPETFDQGVGAFAQDVLAILDGTAGAGRVDGL